MRKIFLLTTAMILTSASAAMAIPTYSYVVDRSSVNAGDTVSVYLKETLASGDTSVIVADGGLFGFGFALSYVGGVGPLDILDLNSNLTYFGDVGTGAGLHGTIVPASGQTPSQATLLANLNLSNPLVVPDSNGLILLGTVTISPNAQGLPAVFKLGPYIDDSSGQLFGNTITNQGTDLDVSSTSPAFTGANDVFPTYVTVFASVPEPVALAPLGLLSLALVTRARRK